MAKVLMVRPRHPAFKGLNKTATPPLGLMCLAAYARRERPGKDEFIVLDERIYPKDMDQWSAYVGRVRPGVIAFSVMSVERQRLLLMARRIKRDFPGIRIIVGGPHASAAGVRLLESGCIDYILAGEGEIGFVKWLDALDRQDYFPREPISGLAFQRPGGECVCNPANLEAPDINALPFPAWDLVDLKDYEKLNRFTPTESGARYALLFTSRGCPYHCIYCHKIFSKKFRAMEPNRVVDEIEFLVKEHRVHSFEVVDDIFNLDKDRAMAICREIKRRGLKTRFSFPNGVRGDRMDRELIRELVSVGAYEMAFSVESASPRLQKFIRKNMDLAKITENINIAVEEGVFAWGYFMLGFPTETRWEILSTLWYAWRSRLHGAGFFNVMPYEGTELAAMLPPGHQVAGRDINGDYHFSSGSLCEVGPGEQSFYQALAFLCFYFDPRRMYRIIRDYPHDIRNLVGRALQLSQYLFYEKPLTALSIIFGGKQSGSAASASNVQTEQ